MSTPRSKNASRKKRLKNYALLAGAAVALPVSSQASVIFTNVSLTTTGTNFFDLDVNGDGFNDLAFTAYANTTGSGGFQVAENTVGVFTGAQLVVDGSNNLIDLAPGATIDASNTYLSGTGILSKEGITSIFPTDGTTPGYLGFQFTAIDGVHYGYLQVSTLLGSKTTFDKIFVTQIAYDSSKNTGIVIPTGTTPPDVPEPDTLCLFAVGAIGIEILRRRRAKATRLQ